MPNSQGASKAPQPKLKNHPTNFNKQLAQSKNHSSTEFNFSSSQNKTYAYVTSNQEPPNSDNSNQLDTGTLLSKFISDFQAIINPLLSLLTTSPSQTCNPK